MTDKNSAGPTRRLRLLGGVAATLMLGGCVSFSADAGLAPAQTVAYTELNKDVVKITSEAEAVGIQQRVEDLLKRPLTPDSAVQIALLKNRGLQAAFNELGVSEADYVQTSLPPSPTRRPVAARRQPGAGDRAPDPHRAVRARHPAGPDRGRRAALPRGPVPHRRGRAPARRRDPPANTTAPSPPTSRSPSCSRRSATAETASELAKQLGESGALNKLEQAREHAFYQELGAQLARARIEQKVARERLIRQLGLWGRDIDFRLPSSLPPLPARIASAQDIERRALRTARRPAGAAA